MENNGRDNKGRFIKGRTPTLEEKRLLAEGVKKYYEKFIPSARLREQNPYIFNSWRSIFYTEKGRKAGCSTPEWKTFENFYNDVSPSYETGLKFHRVDTSLPFSKDNFIWVTNEQARLMEENRNLVRLNYDGEELTLKEASVKYNQPYNAIKMRYYRHRDVYSDEDIIFGVKAKRGSRSAKDEMPNTQRERNKASKMISTYKCKDKRNGFTDVCDIDINWMIENIIHKPCTYCGDTHLIGCDRIDNNKGHTKENVIPCCYSCNTVRNNQFSYEEMKILGKTIKKIKAARQKTTIK